MMMTLLSALLLFHFLLVAAFLEKGPESPSHRCSHRRLLERNQWGIHRNYYQDQVLLGLPGGTTSSVSLSSSSTATAGTVLPVDSSSMFSLRRKQLTGRKKRSRTNYFRRDQTWLQNLLSSSSSRQNQKSEDYLLWLDLENIRGKTGFAMTHSQLLEYTTVWMEYYDSQQQQQQQQQEGHSIPVLKGHVVVVADHGSLSQAYYYRTDNKEDHQGTLIHRSHDDDYKTHDEENDEEEYFGSIHDDDDEEDDSDDEDDDPGIVVVFSGDRYPKADDLLADWVGTVSHSIIVTADIELQSRCKRSAISYQIVEPDQFLDDLERIISRSTTTNILNNNIDKKNEQFKQNGLPLQEYETQNTEGLAIREETEISQHELLEQRIHLGQLDDEIRLRGQILDTQVQLDKKVKGTNKRRKKLQAKLNRLQTLLARRGPSLLEQVVVPTMSSTAATPTTIPTTTMGGSISEQQQHSLIFQRYKELHARSHRKEQTGDRVLLAEDLRRQLEATNIDVVQSDDEYYTYRDSNPADDDPSSSSHGIISPAKAFLRAFNKRFSQHSSTFPLPTTNHLSSASTVLTTKDSDTPSTKDMLSNPTVTNPLYSLDQIDICAISDTHGFEGQLLDADGKDTLPSADVLIHLGDFSLEGSAELEAVAWKTMDEWLARQPHPVKIVVRGNHDPFHLSFPLSGAWYITEPTTVQLTNSLTLGAVPYGSSRKLSASQGLPKKCDILASHVPPLHTLDRTLTGKAAGSGFLNKVVAPMQPKPLLWLCGHIHEGRGVARRGTTTVINAANANRGRATHLDHGAVVVRVKKDDPINILHMEDKIISSRQISSEKFFPEELPKDTETGLLLAVDLGLKSGVSLFSSCGKLLRYEQFYFSRDDIQEKSKQLLIEWEKDAAEIISANDGNVDSRTESPSPAKITHVAIEGADSFLFRAWKIAADETCLFLRVSPDEWRTELLLEKERTSGSNAKAASRLIARQVVEDFGIMSRHQGKFPTDVAEAVCLGLYVSNKLGWIQRDGGSVVNRYTNGNIIIPR